jgi:PKD repeat protein
MTVGMRRVFPALLIAMVAAACSQSELPALDASPDLTVWDAPATASDKPLSLAVDFTVENCPLFDPVALTCTGKVPLALRFVPLSTTTVTGYRWDFGDWPLDLATTTTATPSHVFSRPGTYTVRLFATGESGGSASKEHVGFVVARANTIGDPCEANAQCEEPDLFCLCPATAGCTNGPPRGMCTSACSSGRCGEKQACADLLTAGVGVEPWQTSLCLPTCEKDADCAAELHCRLLPPGGSGGWVTACFSDMPRDIGEPCRDSNGKLRDDFCVTGLCVDFGALGMCSKKCSDLEACPRGSDCMIMGDSTQLCLRPCGDRASFPCNRDPLLTCVQPTTGALGYQIPSSSNTNNTSFASSYCAPKSCTANDTPAPCAPSGTCMFAEGGSHCVRR